LRLGWLGVGFNPLWGATKASYWGLGPGRVYLLTIWSGYYSSGKS